MFYVLRRVVGGGGTCVLLLLLAVWKPPVFPVALPINSQTGERKGIFRLLLIIKIHSFYSSSHWLSFSPLQANLTHLPRSAYVPGIGSGMGKCPYDPLDNSTAIYVEEGNPGNLPALVRIRSSSFYCSCSSSSSLAARSRKREHCNARL